MTRRALGNSRAGNANDGSDRPRFTEAVASHPAGAPPLDWWEVAPGGYPGAHYAVWPPQLLHRPIESMCPRRVCLRCGEPSRRVVDTARVAGPDDSQRRKHADGERPAPGRMDRAPEVGWQIDRTTTGWTTCGCPGTTGLRLDGYHRGPGWRPGVVLDPFAGSGTTLLVAHGHGRDAVGIDIDHRNASLALARLGPLAALEVAWPPGDLTRPALPPGDPAFDAYRQWGHLLDGHDPDAPTVYPDALTAPAVTRPAPRPVPELAGQTALL